MRGALVTDQGVALRRPEPGDLLEWNGVVHVVHSVSRGVGWSGSTTFQCKHRHSDALFRVEAYHREHPNCVGCLAGYTR